MTHEAFKTKQEVLPEAAFQLNGQWPAEKTKRGHTELQLTAATKLVL